MSRLWSAAATWSVLCVELLFTPTFDIISRCFEGLQWRRASGTTFSLNGLFVLDGTCLQRCGSNKPGGGQETAFCCRSNVTNCRRADVVGMFSIDPFSLNAQDLCSKRVKVEEAFSSPSLKGGTTALQPSFVVATEEQSRIIPACVVNFDKVA